MNVMKDMPRKANERREMRTTDGGSELLAADCEKALLHAGLEDTKQKMV